MAPRNHLTPTPTVDKNGKLTTVYRKQATSTSSPAGVPAPSLADISVERKMELIRSFLSGYEIGNRDDSTLMETTRTVAAYPVDLLEKLCSPEIVSSDYHWMIKSMVSDGCGSDFMNEYLYFLPDVSEASIYTSQALVKSLHGYSQLPSSADYSRDDEATRAKCSALLRFSNAARLVSLEVFRDDEFRFTLKDHALVELILENHGSIETLVAAVRERRSADPEMLASVLETDSPTLERGIL